MEASSSIFFWFGKIPIYRIKRKHKETRRERTPQPLKVQELLLKSIWSRELVKKNRTLQPA